VSGRPLDSRTWVEHASGQRTVLLLPVGSFEQHGPHLPLSTDSRLAAALCADVAAERAVDVAPVLAYGASGEHAGFPGLLSIGTAVTTAVLVELVRCARDSWSGVVVVSGHGGNLDALVAAAAVAAAEGDHLRWWVPRDGAGDPHAGASETSVMLTIDPALVGEPPEPVALIEGWADVARRGGVRAVSANGVLGDASASSAQRGWALRRAWCAEVVALVDELRGSP
jgi:creatinine amidohydrolase